MDNHEEFDDPIERGSHTDEPEPMSILEEARSVVTGPRRRDYGSPVVNFRRIAEKWSVSLEEYVKRCVQEAIELSDIPYAAEVADSICARIDTAGLPAMSNRTVGHLMMDLKVARDIQTPKRDNLVDLAGYADATDLATEGEAA